MRINKKIVLSLTIIFLMGLSSYNIVNNVNDRSSEKYLDSNTLNTQLPIVEEPNIPNERSGLELSTLDRN